MVARARDQRKLKRFDLSLVARARPKKPKVETVKAGPRGKRASGASKSSGRWSISWGYEVSMSGDFRKIDKIKPSDFAALTARGKDD